MINLSDKPSIKEKKIVTKLGQKNREQSTLKIHND